LTLLFIITSSLNSLLPTRTPCGCMDNPLVLKTRSTDAVLARIQKNSYTVCANQQIPSFIWLGAKVPCLLHRDSGAS